MKGIPARPVDKPDVGVRDGLTVVVHGAAGVHQHVGDPRHRDGQASWVWSLGYSAPSEAAAIASGIRMVVSVIEIAPSGLLRKMLHRRSGLE